MFLRQQAVLVHEGFEAADAAWALRRAGLGGLEEARDMLCHAEQMQTRPQYCLREASETGAQKQEQLHAVRNVAYVDCASLEAAFWRKRIGGLDPVQFMSIVDTVQNKLT